MFKRNIIYLALLTALLPCSCGKQDSPRTMETGAPVPIVLGTNVSVVALSKAAGAQGALDGWTGQDLYVYGIESSSSGLNLSDGGRFIDGVKVQAPPDGELSGAIAVYNPAVSSGNEPFYYEGSKRYEFFAYYKDDALLGAPAIGSSSISFPITIDGSQDIMAAVTDHESDLAKARVGADVRDSDLYSAYSARRDVHPNLIFSHLLSRFEFKVQTGFTDSDSRAGKIKVAGLKVDTPSKATLTVVGDNPGLAGQEAPDELYLRVGTAGSRVLLGTGNAVPVSESPETLGEMMLFPGHASYPVTIYLMQDGYSVQETFPVSMEIKFDPDDPDESARGAMAGTKYIVTIVIWGLEQVQTKVEMTLWQGGRSFNLDPDEIEDKN